jgi:carbamoyl-phosphate synthase large subunit
MAHRQYNVLVTSVGSTTSIGIIKCIRQSSFDVQTVGTDINNYDRIAGSSLCDKFYKVPPFYHEEYISALKDVVSQNKIDFIIPVHDQEVEQLASCDQQFSDLNCKVITSGFSTIKAANDKLHFARTLADAGIAVPPTYEISNWHPAQGLEKKNWLLKPISGVSSRGISIGSAADLKSIISSKQLNGGYIVQEFIDGIEFTVDVFVKEKVPYCIVPRVRDEVREGLCYKAHTVPNTDFVRPVNAILQLFDFYGPINLQFIQDRRTNELFCIECNPRFGGTSIITLHAGINLFEMIINEYEGKQLQERYDYKPVFMTRYWEEIIYEN